MGIRITTWNVNGIRNPFGYQPWRGKRTFDGMFDILEADIVVMQELKIQPKDLRDDMVLVPGWDCYFSLPRHKKGYSGVGIYTRQSVCAPIRAEEGILGVLCPRNSTTAYCDLPDDQHIGGYLSNIQLESLDIDAKALDAEGRCVVVEFPAFVLFGIYAPANSNGERDDFRHAFHNALDMRVRNLIAQGKRVIVTGDLNVSRNELDTANAAETMRKEGITHEDYMSTPNRRIFNQLLEGGEVIGERDSGREVAVLWDICRGFHPDRKGMYTHWEQKINARPGNFGSRIDFILCSLDMKFWFSEANIQEGLVGSDHCPVYAIMKDTVEAHHQQVNLKDIMNPPGTFKDGHRLKEYSLKDAPAFSGKLLPEFDKRRTLRDMFSKRPSLVPLLSSQVTGSGPIAIEEAENLKSSDVQPENTPSLILEGSMVPALITPSRNEDEPKYMPSVIANIEKKRVRPENATSRSFKRSKSGSSISASVPPTKSQQTSKGQQSLKGFFTPKTPASSASIEGGSDHKVCATLPANGTELDKEESGLEPISKSPLKTKQTPTRSQSACDATSISSQPPPDQGANAPTSVASSADFIDPIVSKDSWSKLFTKPIAPRCESHDEPCKIMLTKKKGFNCGREFWMCARPLGPSGAKERNTQWRCGTFIWSSDWNGTTEKGG